MLRNNPIPYRALLARRVAQRHDPEQQVGVTPLAKLAQGLEWRFVDLAAAGSTRQPPPASASLVKSAPWLEVRAVRQVNSLEALVGSSCRKYQEGCPTGQRLQIDDLTSS